MSELLRLFVGIFPSQTTQQRLNREAANWSKKLHTKVQILAPELLHLTIKFIGNVDHTKLEDFTTAFLEATDNLPSTSLQIKQLTLFPSSRKPRVLAAQIDRSPELQDIFQCFNRSFCNLGIYAEERSFKPHITVARSRRWQKETISSVPFHLVEPTAKIALVRSQLSPAGAKYTVVTSIPLS